MIEAEDSYKKIKTSKDKKKTTKKEMRSENDGEGGHDEDVVGLEEVVQLLFHKAIFYNAQGLWTSFIRGMSGIGKTTLAKRVFNHASVINRFESRFWVCATDLSPENVLKKLMQHVVDSENLQRDSSLLEKLERANYKSLKPMLCQLLQGMRYLIVLDDMPKGMDWGSFLEAFPREVNGCRLLITSRSVVWNLHQYFFYIHEMKTLDSNKSWQLFLKTINFDKKLTSELQFPKHLEKKGREVLTKCGGLPLAIKEVGRQLAKKRQSGSEWEQLLESIDFGATLDLLESSYQRLDSQEKLCFLHLAFFKENTTIRIQKLMLMMCAGKEGLATHTSMALYIEKLISESIIEVKDKRTFTGVKSGDINALLHKLSIKKAEDEMGFEILNKDGSNRLSKSPRHRVISCSRDEFDYSTDQDKHIMSLFFHGGGYFDSSPSYWKSFEQLRRLDMEDFGLKILPESIGTLTELRYLGLRNNYIKELPHSLGGLKKLEFLDIALNFMVEIPDIIWELCSLRHLYMSDVIFRKPLKIDMLRNLESLTNISVDDLAVEHSDLETLILRKLGIEGLDGNSDLSNLSAFLSNYIAYIYELILRGFRFRCMPMIDESLMRTNAIKLDGLLPMLPSSYILRNITSLRLVNSCLDEDPMPVLEKLPRLKHLKLRNAYTGKEMVISYRRFQSLNILCIEELWDLRNVRVAVGAMRVLNQLEINNCPYLESLPEEIGSMYFLNELKMVTTKKIATKIRKSSFISKIEHVDIKP